MSSICDRPKFGAGELRAASGSIPPLSSSIQQCRGFEYQVVCEPGDCLT